MTDAAYHINKGQGLISPIGKRYFVVKA